MKTLKKVLCSILTLALMVIMFAGSGMEVKAEEGTGGYFQYSFSASHAPGMSINSGLPSSFEDSEVSAEDILSDVRAMFASCNVVGVYEDEDRTTPISGTYTGGASRENATELYIEFDCPHADVPSVSNFWLTDASYDSETKKIKATFTFDYSKMDGQWLFVFETENCAHELDWGWAAYGNGVASADSVFTVEDENEPLVILSGKFYLPEYREEMFPISMPSITIDPKDPTANVVEFPSQSSGGSCGSSTEAAPANKNASEPAKEVVQTPENNYSVFQEATVKNVEKAIEAAAANAVQAAATGTRAVAEPVKIDTGVWISFKGNVYQKLQDSGLPVQITFMYKGERYRVDIPAGADLMSLVDENGYCGFLNLMAHFGGTKL